MLMFRRLLLHAAVRAASDPRAQAKARELFDQKVRPRAQEAWRRTKPKVEAVREDVREAARTTDPRRDPGRFAAEVVKRWRRPR